MLLEARDVCIRLADQTPVIEDVTFTLAPGEMLAVVGRSGAGKSTLCRAVMGLLGADYSISGSLCFGDHDLLHLRAEKRQQLYGGAICLIMQNPMTAFNPSLRMGQQLMKTWQRHHPGSSPAECRGQLTELLARLGLDDQERILKSYPSALSGGMLQRLMIACALMNGPELLVADEATTAIDANNRAALMQTLRRFCDDGMAVLFVTHDLRAAAKADRLLVLAEGRIVEQGATAEVLKAPKHPVTQRLLDACTLERRE